MMWYNAWFNDEMKLEAYLRHLDKKGFRYNVDNIRNSDHDITGYKVTVFVQIGK